LSVIINSAPASRTALPSRVPLAHHIDIDWLREAYRRTRKNGASGVDRQRVALRRRMQTKNRNAAYVHICCEKTLPEAPIAPVEAVVSPRNGAA
jgi:hypothetical protein